MLITSQAAPIYKPHQLLADRFVEFSTGKIEKLCSIFPIFLITEQHIFPDISPPTFSTFSTLTYDQVAKSIKTLLVNPVPLTLGPHFLSLII